MTSLRARAGLLTFLLAMGVASAFALPAEARAPERALERRSDTPAEARARDARADEEYRRQALQAGPLEKLAASIGFGNLVGLGLPAVILVGGAMRAADVKPPALVARYIDPSSPLYSWPFVLIALVGLVLFFVSGNEKLSKGPKLLAQIAAIPPAALLAIAIPVVTELSAPGTSTALLAQLGAEVPAGASGASGTVTVVGVLLALAFGFTAFLSAMLILFTRLLVSFLVWLSPFPFVDALVNVVFHLYAGTLVLLTFVAPPVALFLMGVQTFVALILLRRLLRFGGVALTMGGGALRWHLMKRSCGVDVELPPWGGDHLDQEAAAPLPRVRGWLVEGALAPRESPAVVGLTERASLVVARSWFRQREHRIPAMELHEVRVRYGHLFDELVLVHRQGAGVSRREVPFALGLAKSQRRALAALCDELRERGYDVVEEHKGAAGRPRGLIAAPVAA